MLSAKELRELRAKLVHQARTEILERAEAENRDMTAEEQQQWERVMGGTRPDGTTVRGEVDVLMDRITRIEAAERVGSSLAAPAGEPRIGREDRVPVRGGDGANLEVSEQTRSLALAGWLSAYSPRGAAEDQVAACRALRVNPFSSELAIGMYSTEDARALQTRFRQHHPNQAAQRCADFRATLTSGSGPGGGYLIAPESLRADLEINMLYYGGMRQVAEQIRTATGELLSWPTADDTTNTGAQLGEATSIGSSVDPTFGKVFWSAYKFTSKPILVPYELLQDSIFNLPAILGEMLGERLGRVTNTKFTTGTGAATAKGIVTCAAAFSAVSATAIAADDILGLVHSVDPAYRNMAGFMMHDNIVLALRKLKNGEGDYLWQSGLRDGSPDRLLGYGVTVNQDMDSTIASGKKSILFGQLSRYKIRTVAETRLHRLQERFRDTDSDAFIAFLREDGNLLMAGTSPVKYLSH